MHIKDDVLKKLLQRLCVLTYEYDTKAVTAPADDTLDATHSLVASLFQLRDLDLHRLVRFIIHHENEVPDHPAIPRGEWGEKLLEAIKKVKQ
jgi:hypothetical protein